MYFAQIFALFFGDYSILPTVHSRRILMPSGTPVLTSDHSPNDLKRGTRMSINVLLTLVEQYKEAAQLIEAAQAEQEQLKIQIREALAERSTNYLEVGCHKVRLSDFSSTRLDSKAIKAVAPDLYDQYSKTVTGTRLSIT